MYHANESSHRPNKPSRILWYVSLLELAVNFVAILLFAILVALS